MQSIKDQGYDKSRFTELNGDSFDCGICFHVCKVPKECMKCGTMFCQICINNWLTKNTQCPIGCSDAKSNIRDVVGALAKIYRNLDIKCSNPKCGKSFKIHEIDEHELSCGQPDCEFTQHCKNKVGKGFEKEGVCGEVCQFLKKVKASNNDWKALLTHIKALHKEYTGNVGGKMPVGGGGSISQPISVGSNSVNWKWDGKCCGKGITISGDGSSVYLKENAYMFRSVIGDTPFNGGVHYWEIHADPRTENELKIGVAGSKNFNFDTSFSDFAFGYAYYGLGQLRHNSNSIGAPYGKKFKKQGVLGVCLDMNKGTLSFALDGDYWGEAYKDANLKKGPMYPALSLLHNAGCKVVTGKPAPSYFK